MSLLVSPINPAVTNFDVSDHQCVMILLGADYSKQSISADLLASFYSLTPAEARLVEKLCQGYALDEVADNFGLSKNTWRSQLALVFSKMGVSRQSALIALISAGPLGLIKST